MNIYIIVIDHGYGDNWIAGAGVDLDHIQQIESKLWAGDRLASTIQIWQNDEKIGEADCLPRKC